jgi:hypothetical protein
VTAASAARSEHSAPPPLAPDLDAAGEFLDAWIAVTGAPHITLVAILPDPPDPRFAARGRTFQWPRDRAAALQWITSTSA